MSSYKENRHHNLHLHYNNENKNSSKVGGPHGGRVKRQAVVSHNVQVVLVGDYGLFTRFLAVNGNNDLAALAAMTDYYANVFRAVNRRYESAIRPDFSVRVTPTAFLFLTAPNSSPWTEGNKVGDTVRGATSLIAFNPFGAILTSTFGVDHATLITGYDLRSSDLQNDLLGVAYTFGVCSEEPTSLVEESFTEQTANTLAHEIGHSLGMHHDGDANSCPADDFFVMAPTSALPTTRAKASNPWTFSPCSVEVLTSFLALSDAACTLIDEATSVTDFSSYTIREYGQRVDADAQCQARYGPLSRFCRQDYLVVTGLTFDDMCYNMKCFNPVAGRCVQVPAHDGTSCGDGKWCFKGMCVANSQAPSRSSNCPQLDDATRSCSLASCADPVTAFLYCCGTCSQISPSMPPSAPPSVGPSPSVQSASSMDFFRFLNI